MQTADLLPAPLGGEPSRWYGRLCEFCLAGPSRTLEQVWRAEAKSSKAKRPPSSWYHASDRWGWLKRTAEFDCLRYNREFIEFDKSRREDRAFRFELVRKLGRLVNKRLSKAPMTGGESIALAALARVYFSASRSESGGEEADLRQDAPSGLRQVIRPQPELRIVVMHESEGISETPAQKQTDASETRNGFYFERT